MIRFEKVTKTYPTGTKALDNVSFTINPGELVVITGPSGSGKTTILRLLLRELIPTSGAVLVDNLNVMELKKRDLPKLRRTIGAVFQDFKLLEDRTAAENISLVLEIIGRNDQDILERVSEVLSAVGLQGKGELFPRQLSGGELQRVAIARALAPKPKILFADEPSGNLDVETTRGIARLLVDIHALGSTIVVATHDPTIIRELATRTLALHQGALKEMEDQ